MAKLDARSQEEKVKTIITALSGQAYGRESPIFAKSLEWMASFPWEVDRSLRVQLLKTISKAFGMTESEILLHCEKGVAAVAPKGRGSREASPEQELLDLAAQSKWLSNFAAYTHGVECPLSYLLMSSFCALGAAMGRNVYMNRGFFQVLPPYAVILIGPTGRVKKTTAVDIVKDLIKMAAVCPIMEDKLTPESLCTALTESGRQFIYIPELSFFFGKQKYMESMGSTILRVLDQPKDGLKIRTVTRPVEIGSPIAVSMLAGSTLSLIGTSSSAEVSSSGFLNRFVVVVEHDTPRSICDPFKGTINVEKDLVFTLKVLSKIVTEMTFSKEAQEWHTEWYRKWKAEKKHQDDLTVELLERQQAHMIRTGMSLHLADCRTSTICLKCMMLADQLLRACTKNTPGAIAILRKGFETVTGERLVDLLYALGGAADHSTLLRRAAACGYTAETMKKNIRSLNEMGKVKITKRGAGTYYTLVEDQE